MKIDRATATHAVFYTAVAGCVVALFLRTAAPKPIAAVVSAPAPIAPSSACVMAAAVLARVGCKTDAGVLEAARAGQCATIANITTKEQALALGLNCR